MNSSIPSKQWFVATTFTKRYGVPTVDERLSCVGETDFHVVLNWKEQTATDYCEVLHAN